MGIYGTCEICNTNHDGSCREADILKAVISKYDNLVDKYYNAISDLLYDQFLDDAQKIDDFYRKHYKEKFEKY